MVAKWGVGLRVYSSCEKEKKRVGARSYFELSGGAANAQVGGRKPLCFKSLFISLINSPVELSLMILSLLKVNLQCEICK